MRSVLDLPDMNGTEAVMRGGTDTEPAERGAHEAPPEHVLGRPAGARPPSFASADERPEAPHRRGPRQRRGRGFLPSWRR